MSAIKQALINLNAVIDKLEDSAQLQSEAFADALEEASSKSLDVDPAVVAKKLDLAIQKVESVLSESQAQG